jgi:hypothetical protein
MYRKIIITVIGINTENLLSGERTAPNNDILSSKKEYIPPKGGNGPFAKNILINNIVIYGSILCLIAFARRAMVITIYIDNELRINRGPLIYVENV